MGRGRSVIPSGESPDGTGGSPVLPSWEFSNTLLGMLVKTVGPGQRAFGDQFSFGFQPVLHFVPGQ